MVHIYIVGESCNSRDSMRQSLTILLMQLLTMKIATDDVLILGNPLHFANI